MRTHEPCVPTSQANFPHGLLSTTYYLLLALCVFRGLLYPHKFGQRLSVLCEKRLTQRRKGREALCPFVLLSKIVAHTETHRICSACFCESLRCLRETIPHRMVLCVPWIPCETTSRRLCETLRLCVRQYYTAWFCVFRGFCVKPCSPPQGIRVNSCPLVAQKIREDTSKSVEKFCAFRGLLSPHKFGQRLSVLCETTSRAFA